MREDKLLSAVGRLEALLLERLDAGEFKDASPEMFKRLRERVKNSSKRRRKGR